VAHVLTPDGTEIASGEATAVPDGIGGTLLTWDVPVAPQASPLCVSLNSESASGTVVDAAPNGVISPCASGGPADENPPAGGWM
jgi:hypothetical protein